jgi:hypothetical protein
MALDTGKAKDSLFGNIKKAKEEQSVPHEMKSETVIHQENKAVLFSETEKKLQNEESGSETLAKWQQFDKVTALLTGSQKEGLDRIAKKLMKFRSKQLKGNEEKERITANTLIRALIENFLRFEDSLELEVLVSEDDVCNWLSRIIKK